MAKRANRNLAQLQKDNRQSTIPWTCSRKQCDSEALVIKGPQGRRVKVCKVHYFAKSTKAAKDTALFKSLGLL